MTYICAECGSCFERAGYCSIDGTPLVIADDPLLGVELGRYRITRVIAEGGMGRVYLGVQPEIGSRVAIKVLSDQCARDAGLLERFFAEARAVNLIRHESIASVLDLAKLEDGRPYIVMEFIDGHTLASLVRSGTAPLGGVVQVMTEVLSALAAAHEIGIVHRDLKPDNVLVTTEGHAKVLDFGIAKLSPGISQQQSPRTRTGALLGTPAYMAPEQISGSGQIDPRTDIYAAGVVLYEAVTGRVPFQGESLFDLMRLHLEALPPSPSKLRLDLPEAVEQVILVALAKQPEHRFQSAAAMAQALQNASAGLPPEAWRSLSSRGAMIPGGRASITRIQITDGPATRPALAPETGDTVASVAPRPVRRARRRWAVGAAAAAIAALAIGIGVDRGAVSPPAAAPAEAVAGSAVAGSVVAGSVVAGSAVAGSVVAGSVVAGSAVASSEAPGGSPPVEPPAAPAGSATRGSPPAPRPGAGAGGGSARTRTVTTYSGTEVQTELGPGVHVVQSAPQQQVWQPADYDPRRFDPVAYLPAALALARRLAPDARLTRFDFDPVFSDGRVDLTKPGRDRQYGFRSEASSRRPAGIPPNVAFERPCRIDVDVEPRRVTARVIASEDCDEIFVRHPRCSFATVWRQALAKGVPADHVARIAWLFDEKWFFDIDLQGKGGGVSTFEDRCP